MPRSRSPKKPVRPTLGRRVPVRPARAKVEKVNSVKSPAKQSAGAPLSPKTPGWISASADLFKEPFSPSPVKQRATRRTSVYRTKVIAEKKITKVSKSPEFKVPAPKSRRHTMAPKSFSPAMTRARRRESVYVRKTVTKRDSPSPVKIWPSPAVHNRRMTLAAVPNISPPKLVEEKAKTSPVKSAEKKPVKKSPARSSRKSSPAKSARKSSPAKSARKSSPAKSPQKSSPAKDLQKPSPAKRNTSIGASPVVKKTRSMKNTTGSAKKETPVGPKSRTRSRKSQGSAKSASVSSNDKSKTPSRSVSIAKTPQRTPKTPQRKPMLRSPRLNLVKTPLPKSAKKVLVSTTPKGSTVLRIPPSPPKMSAAQMKSVLDESESEITDDEIIFTKIETKKRPRDATPKPPSPKATPKTGEKSVKRAKITQTPQRAKDLVNTPKSVKRTIAKSPARSAKKSASTPKLTSSAKRVTNKIQKTPTSVSPARRGRPARKSVSSPVIRVPSKTPAKAAKVLGKPITPSGHTPPKAVRLLGKSPARSTIMRQVTPARTPKTKPLPSNVARLRAEASPKTSTPVRESARKRKPTLPVSEIRQVKKLRSSVVVTETNISQDESSVAMTTAVPPLDMTDAAADDEVTQQQPEAGGWFSYCTIL